MRVTEGYNLDWERVGLQIEEKLTSSGETCMAYKLRD